MFCFEASLRARLLTTLAVSLAIVLLSGLFAVYQTKNILNQFSVEGEVYDAQERAIRDMEVDFTRQVQEWKDVLLRGNQHWQAFKLLEKEVQGHGQALLAGLEKSQAKSHLLQFLAAHEQMAKS